MSTMNQYSHRRFFRETRNKSRNSCPDVSAIRKCDAPAALNHSRPIVAGNPNVEMSQISQLSMDSSLRTYSQSSNFVDMPLGQPSASTGSHNSHTHSSSSSFDEQLRHSRYPDKAFYLSEYPDTCTRSTMSSQLPDIIGKARSSFKNGSIDSSFRRKKKEKVKKTRFASIGDTHSVIDRFKRNSSYSSSRSCGSHRTPHSGFRVQIQHPKPTTTYTQDASRSDSNSPFQPQRPLRQYNADITNQNVHDQNHDVNYRGSKQIYVLNSSTDFRRKSSDKAKQHASSVALLNSIFLKTATPRKKLNIRYPSLQSQPHHHEQVQVQQEVEKHTDEDADKTKNEMVNSRNEVDDGCSDQIETGASPNNEVDIYNDEKMITRKGTDKRVAIFEELRNKKEQTDSQSSIPVPKVRLVTGPTNANISDHVASEPEKFNDQIKEDEADLRIRLEKILSDVESEAKEKLQNLTHRIISATESKLDQQNERIQEQMKSELGEKASTIKEETQFNLEKKLEVIETSIQNVLDQKQVEAEKTMEKFFDSKTTRFKEIASASVAKLEVCTESCLAKLSKFTETWLTNSCNVIAHRLRPFLFPSSGSRSMRDNSSDSAIDQDTNVQREKSLRDSLITSTNSDRLKRKLSMQLDPLAQNSSSSIDNEVSMTQGSETKAYPTRRLRRSKRTKHKNKKKQCNGIDKSHVPLTNRMSPSHSKEESLESPLLIKNKGKKTRESTEGLLPLEGTNNEKAPCVTPTVGNSQPRNKFELTHKTTPKNNKEYKVGPKTVCPPETRHRKRRNGRHASKKKPSETESNSSRDCIPSEIFAFNDLQLSPLEDADLLPYCAIKRNSKSVGFGRCSGSKKISLSGKRKRNAISRTYKRRKKSFDVTDTCTFSF